MTFASPSPPFVVYDPLLWVGFREAVKGSASLVGLRDRPFLGRGAGVGLPPSRLRVV